MKIFVAIPVYDGKLSIPSIVCLLEEQVVALKLGDEFQVRLLSSNAGITQARNQLVKEFMESGFDRLVFLDSDITFEQGSLVKLAYMPADFVGGCYRYKQVEEKYPINFLPGEELWHTKHGLIPVQSLPTGFLALSRKVFETLEALHPERSNSDIGGGNMAFGHFQMPFVEGQSYGEDIYFCREWREAGGKIYLQPEIQLTHWNFNPTPHVGHIGQWLKNNSKATAALRMEMNKPQAEVTI